MNKKKANISILKLHEKGQNVLKFKNTIRQSASCKRSVTASVIGKKSVIISN